MLLGQIERDEEDDRVDEADDGVLKSEKEWTNFESDSIWFEIQKLNSIWFEIISECTF